MPRRIIIPGNFRPDSFYGFADDAPLQDNMYDRYYGRFLDPYRAPIRTEPDWTYDRYQKLKPIPTKKGKAKAKPIPLTPDRPSLYITALEQWLNRSRRG